MSELREKLAEAINSLRRQALHSKVNETMGHRYADELMPFIEDRLRLEREATVAEFKRRALQIVAMSVSKHVGPMGIELCEEIKSAMDSIALSTDADLLEKVIAEAVTQGRMDMIRWVRDSIAGYPDTSGDIEVMKDVEKIVADATADLRAKLQQAEQQFEMVNAQAVDLAQKLVAAEQRIRELEQQSKERVVAAYERCASAANDDAKDMQPGDMGWSFSELSASVNTAERLADKFEKWAAEERSK